MRLFAGNRSLLPIQKAAILVPHQLSKAFEWRAIRCLIAFAFFYGVPLFKLSVYEIRTNLLSGLTVALAMVPEAIAFALVAHVSPLTGLYAAFIVSLITSVFGGRPRMI